jgi:diguanylate cyclase (GGDEF)-like protein
MMVITNLRHVILLFSLLLIGLLLWLSISFLLVANNQRQEARRLSSFIETNSALRATSAALAEERSASYWLTGIDGLLFAGESLIKPRALTDELLQIGIDRVNIKIKDPGYAEQLRFQPSNLAQLIGRLDSKIAALQSKREALELDLRLPSALRDKPLQLEVLDFYRELIEDLEVLRHGTSYIASGHSRETDNVLVISNAAWNIGLSNKLLTALFEGYITSGNTALGDARNQTNALRAQIERNLETIRRIVSYANLDPELANQALELDEWYSNHYLVPVRRLSVAIANRLESPYTNYEWRQAGTTLDQYIQHMLDRADELSRESVSKEEQRALKNLIIDGTLVVFCMFLMLCSLWIVRRMHHQATHDELTELPNRRSFKYSCEEKLDSAVVKPLPASLLMIDLYKFKAINDTLGQVVGDQLLRQVATRLQHAMASKGITARLGGDEFAVLLANNDSTSASYVAAELFDTLSGLYTLDEQSVALNVCIGYASFPEHAKTSEELRKAADLALYEAKQKGPGTVQPYRKSFGQAFLDRQVMEKELSRAIERNEFELVYQPQFDLKKQVVGGVEALIRWQHPTRGTVSPFHFIPVAEEAGMLPLIGQWVIDEAIRQAACWRADYGLDLRMSVNVSTHQFLNGDLVAIIKEALRREKLEPSALEIEITESVAMAELEVVIDKLNALHELGIRIALDDFGTGYSSLSYLQDLPLDTLKIDRTFVTKVDGGTRTQKLLLESIAGMAKLLEFHTVAEGVETDRQLDKVRALGIDTVQGYYYSKPISGAQIPIDVPSINETHGCGRIRAA